jgi:hypothetical protein
MRQNGQKEFLGQLCAGAAQDGTHPVTGNGCAERFICKLKENLR